MLQSYVASRRWRKGKIRGRERERETDHEACARLIGTLA